MSHRARLDVPAPTLKAVTRWIAAARRQPGCRPWQRAASVHAQVLLVLRWLRHRADLPTLAADTGVSDATAYRYLHEGVDVIAAHAPTLPQVLARAHADRLAFMCLDGTLVPTDRVAARAEAGHHLWYSGKHHRFGGNVQVIADPSGFPLFVSDVRPESTHDLTAAREQILGVLYPHSARWRPDRLPVLADKGYIGAGIGVLVPVKRPRGTQRLGVNERAYNRLPAASRARAEGANARLKRWRALERVSIDPSRISTIAAAALVLTSLQRGHW